MHSIKFATAPNIRRSLSVTSVLLIAISYSALVLDRETIIWLTVEDSLFENISAVALFCAAALFGWLAYRERNGWALMLCIILFVACGEEISWGQRIIGFETPNWLKYINAQGEVNIHNLIWFQQDATHNVGSNKLLTLNLLFFIALVAYCLVLPILYQSFNRARIFLNMIQLPVVALEIGVLFILSYAISKLLQWSCPPTMTHSIVEIKESTYALLWVFLGLELLLRDSLYLHSKRPMDVVRSATV